MVYGSIKLDGDSFTEYFFDITSDCFNNIFEISDFDRIDLEKKVLNLTSSKLKGNIKKSKKVKMRQAQYEYEISKFKLNSRLADKPTSKKRQLLYASKKEAEWRRSSNNIHALESEKFFYNEVLNNLQNFVNNGINEFFNVKKLLENIVNDYQNDDINIETRKECYPLTKNVDVVSEVWFDNGETFGWEQIESEEKEIMVTKLSHYKISLTQIPHNKMNYVIKSLNASKNLFLIDPLSIPSYDFEDFVVLNDKVGFKYKEDVTKHPKEFWGGTIPI